MKLTEKLVYLRKEKRLTQSKVSEKLNVSRQAISRWESGVVMPSTENLRCLSELYGVPVDYLLNNDIKQINQSVLLEEKVSESRRTKGNFKSYTIIFLCILIFTIVAVMIYRFDSKENLEYRSFSEMGSDKWENKDVEEFSLIW